MLYKIKVFKHNSIKAKINGKEINKTRARIGQLEISALEKLSYLAKQSGLYDLYIE